MNEPEIEFTTSLDLLRWVGWAQQQAGLEWFRERDLSREQGFALGFLEQNPGSIQRDIAEMTRTSAASVSSLLQGLEKRGLVERRTDATSARTKLVFATPAGIELIQGFGPAMHALEDTILAPLTPDERQVFHDLLVTITSALPKPHRD